MPALKLRQDNIRTIRYQGHGGKHQCVYWIQALESFGLRVYPTGHAWPSRRAQPRPRTQEDDRQTPRRIHRESCEEGEENLEGRPVLAEPLCSLEALETLGREPRHGGHRGCAPFGFPAGKNCRTRLVALACLPADIRPVRPIGGKSRVA